MRTPRNRGDEAEERACEYLRSKGYEIVVRNWRSRSGEIDIIAREGDVLVFVEVKSRSQRTHGGPEGSVDSPKQRRIISSARMFLAQTGCPLATRFDVVTLVGERVRLYRDAFRVDEACSRDC